MSTVLTSLGATLMLGGFLTALFFERGTKTEYAGLVTISIGFGLLIAGLRI